MTRLAPVTPQKWGEEQKGARGRGGREGGGGDGGESAGDGGGRARGGGLAPRDERARRHGAAHWACDGANAPPLPLPLPPQPCPPFSRRSPSVVSAMPAGMHGWLPLRAGAGGPRAPLFPPTPTRIARDGVCERAACRRGRIAGFVLGAQRSPPRPSGRRLGTGAGSRSLRSEPRKPFSRGGGGGGGGLSLPHLLILTRGNHRRAHPSPRTRSRRSRRP